jgi:hypothetical protein
VVRRGIRWGEVVMLFDLRFDACMVDMIDRVWICATLFYQFIDDTFSYNLVVLALP